MKKYYIVNEVEDDFYNSLKENDTLIFEMPSFCSGDYLAKVYKDEKGFYINSKNNYFKGCRDYFIYKFRESKVEKVYSDDIIEKANKLLKSWNSLLLGTDKIINYNMDENDNKEVFEYFKYIGVIISKKETTQLFYKID